MRIYIIGNDGITLCREPPTALNDGEIAVASNEELHRPRSAASGCCAVERFAQRRKAQEGRRPQRADRPLWSAIERLPDRSRNRNEKRRSKQEAVIAMLRRPEGQRSMMCSVPPAGNVIPCAASSRER